MVMAVDEREDLLIKVATLYYEHDYNQEQIAERVNMSRSNVSRLLKEAKEKGYVEIHVRKPVTNVPPLEYKFQERFGLKGAMIVASRGRSLEDTLGAAGRLAARYLENLLQSNDTLAISWGTGVSAAVNALRSREDLMVDVVQMIGSVGTVDASIDGHELARRLATKLGGRYYYLHAPLFVDSQAARDMFLDQPTIHDTLKRARTARVALVGIGTTESSASSFLRAGYLTEPQLVALRAEGAVGETSGWHFDIQGRAKRFEVNNRVIALNLEDVKNIPHVVAVACGMAKRRSILGALRGGYLQALATDDITAAAVLEEADQKI